MANTIQHLKGAPRSFSATIASAAMQSSIRNTLRDPARADRFTANLITMVSHTPKLAECDPKTVVSAALLGEVPIHLTSQGYENPYILENRQLEGKRQNRELCFP